MYCCGFKRGFQGPGRSFPVLLLSGGVLSWLSVVCSRPLRCWWRGHSAEQKASWSSWRSSCGETGQSFWFKTHFLKCKTCRTSFIRVHSWPYWGPEAAVTPPHCFSWALPGAAHPAHGWACCSPRERSAVLVSAWLAEAEPLAAPEICSAWCQPGWLGPVCALTALPSHNSELLQPQAEECRSTACLPPSLPRNNLEQLFLCNILKTCWY